jgi:hypothetical protein
VAPSETFADRFAFARLVRHFRTGKSPDNAEIGRAVARTGQWVTKWAESLEPPTDFRVQEPLASFLGVDVRWLFRGEGEPPMPELWARWLAERERDNRPGYKRVAERHGAKVAEGSPTRPSTKEPAKKAAGARKRGKER